LAAIHGFFFTLCEYPFQSILKKVITSVRLKESNCPSVCAETRHRAACTAAVVKPGLKERVA